MQFLWLWIFKGLTVLCNFQVPALSWRIPNGPWLQSDVLGHCFNLSVVMTTMTRRFWRVYLTVCVTTGTDPPLLYPGSRSVLSSNNSCLIYMIHHTYKINIGSFENHVFKSVRFISTWHIYLYILRISDSLSNLNLSATPIHCLLTAYWFKSSCVALHHNENSYVRQVERTIFYR